MNTDLEKLAARCEAAVYPANTDAEAAELTNIQKAICDLMHRDCDAYSPDYIGSLDAAMTLVPEGLVWSINTFGNPHKASGYVMNARGEQWRCKGYPATPALALCAAALRARAQGERRWPPQPMEQPS